MDKSAKLTIRSFRAFWEHAETDIRLPSYEVLLRIADMFGVSVDFLLGRQERRMLDISDLSDEEAAIVCDMVEVLKKRK